MQIIIFSYSHNEKFLFSKAFRALAFLSERDIICRRERDEGGVVVKLHDKVVLYWLSRCCSVLLPPAEWSQDTYDYPLLLDPEGEQAGHVVIFSAADPVQDLSFCPDSFYICAGPCPALPSTQPIRLAVIPKLTPTAVLNELNDLYGLFARWEREMVRVLHGRESFQALVDSCDMIIGAPMVLGDIQFNCIAHNRPAGWTAYPDTYVDPNHMLPPEFLRQLLETPGYSEMNRPRDVFVNRLVEHVLQKNLFFEDKCVGHLVVPCSDDMWKDAYSSCVLRYAAVYAEQLYARYGSFHSEIYATRALQQFLSDCLEGQCEAGSVPVDLLQANGYREGDLWELVEFRMDTKESQVRYEDYLLRQISDRWAGASCFRCSYGVFALVNRDTFRRQTGGEFRPELLAFLDANHILACVSRPFHALQRLEMARQQTGATFSMRREGEESLICFDDRALDYLLRYGQRDLPAEALCMPAALTLHRYDQERGTSYCDTLLALYRCRSNATMAARELYIARSTLLDRLERIQELTGFRVDADMVERMYMALSLYLLGYTL